MGSVDGATEAACDSAAVDGAAEADGEGLAPDEQAVTTSPRMASNVNGRESACFVINAVLQIQMIGCRGWTPLRPDHGAT
jgi:hypothetical protein